jgi:hypothetical protein
MSTPLITITTANSLRDAIETMQLRNIRRLPVIGGENNNMVGIVTDKDILRAIMKTMPLPTSVGEGLFNDQMQFGYHFMYERFLNDDNFPKGINPGIWWKNKHLLFKLRMVLIDYTRSSIIHGKKKDLFNVSVIFL